METLERTVREIQFEKGWSDTTVIILLCRWVKLMELDLEAGDADLVAWLEAQE